ncbi:dihydropseudooxynicotine hydrolase protein [Penicillium verhagenii]|nr:dihydropseudooxynicotine hydrolase protein [Penicillium verhagenii]
MVQLNADRSFHYELARTLGSARYGAADIVEVLEAGDAITPGDVESFYQVFNDLASHIHAQADTIDAHKFPVSARDAYFRASTYYRCADFYLHGNRQDPRIWDLWGKQTVTFDKAMVLLPSPGERLTLPAADGSFNIPAIFYRALGASATDLRPTLLVCNGFDGSQEEMLHICGIGALERGYNVLTFEGPGQCSVIRDQGVGFISEWEKVVTPVVDYILTRPEVDPSRLCLWGYSMSGYLVLRAAAFEHRIAAVLSVDGVASVFDCFYKGISPEARAAFDAGDWKETDAVIQNSLHSKDTPTVSRWLIEHGLFTFNTTSAFELLNKARQMTIEGIGHQIQCPVWIGCPDDDLFFSGQPERVKEALGNLGTLQQMSAKDGAHLHCHVGASTFMNTTIFGWLDGILAT